MRTMNISAGTRVADAAGPRPRARALRADDELADHRRAIAHDGLLTPCIVREPPKRFMERRIGIYARRVRSWSTW